MSEPPKSAKDIFLAALDTEPTQRAAFLDDACAGDAALRRQVEALLRVHDEPDSFLDSPRIHLGLSGDGGTPNPGPTIDQPITEQPGTQIGPYKLLQQIGEGGFGVVYMAEQTEPVERRVALKIIKPGMDTRQVIARFEAEEQALAMMDHPNIAKVLEAGTTESGRPYFVMELVKGIPMTNYCDQQHLTPKERLDLFIPVCQAVQHAHQKGIIHRDIKPSNVLIALYDDKPVPKVIDFGVAKATSQRLTEKTMFTHYGQIVGTVDYMSPEQANLNQLDIDTRSDIYSLGVLLYELLTGSTPFDRERLRSAAFDEMLRIIREEEPPKPSLRLSTSESLPSIAANRHIEPKKLNTLVRGELDWIVMKALEKDRTRRYETANGFADDIRRYLNDEAVMACPPSAGYRFRKFARRNKVAIVTGSVVAAALIVGIAGLTVSNARIAEERRHAESERDRAEVERQRADANLGLALEVLDEIYVRVTGKGMVRRSQDDQPESTDEPQKVEDVGPTNEAEKDDAALLQRLLKFYETFVGANRTYPALRSAVEEIHRRILALREKLVADSPHAVGYRRALAIASSEWAALLQTTGRDAQAEQVYRKAMKFQKELVDSFPSVPEYRSELAVSQRGLAAALQTSDRNHEAKQHLGEAEDLERDIESIVPGTTEGCICFADFRHPAGLNLVGDASVVDKRLRLTPAEYYKVGGAWFTEKQFVSLGFETTFQFQLSGGADGFAFVVQNYNPTALGVAGSCLGYGDADELGGIPNSLAIEFDTFADVVLELGQHVSVQTDGTRPNKAFPAFSLGSIDAPNLDDGNPHIVKIRYVPGSLTIYLDDLASPALTVPVELAATLDLDQGRAWVGFTGGTGVFFQAHDILSWEYRPLVDRANAIGFGDLALEETDGETAATTAGDDRGTEIVDGDKTEPRARPGRQSGQQLDFPQLIAAEDRRFLEEALTFYEAFARQSSSDPTIRLAIGKAYWRVGDIQQQFGQPEQAMRAYRAALELWQNLVKEFPKMSKFRRQLDAGRETFAKRHRRRGRYPLKRGQYDQAITDLIKAILVDPEYARSCAIRGDLDKALADFTKAIELNPDFYVRYNHLAWLLATCPNTKSRDPNQALEMAKKVVDVAPKEGFVWNTLGVAQYRAGNWKDAIEALNKSIELRQGDSFDFFFLAMAHWQLGDQDEARRWYNQAVEWMDKNKPKNEELRRFRAEAGELLEFSEEKDD